MAERAPLSRRIRILRDEVSRKIAAGEVIDRPLSIVRELLDNALDAGSSSIEVYIEGGGLSRVRMVDDGAGMDKADLELCWQPHATSKIETEDDLLRVTSLGFRGEALSSIAAVSRLEMVSAREGGVAHALVARSGRLLSLAPARGKTGTTVDVSEIFHDFPARKKFLKSASAESALCRGVFVDRAAACPEVSFRLFTDGELKLFLPPAPPADRICLCYSSLGLDPRAVAAGTAEGNGFSVRVFAADPGVRRRDRKLMQAFVNRRRVPEYSLLQAVEHGYTGFMPGGWFPAAFVFVEIDPSLVDFNIHPAKREVRFRNLPDVHAAVVRAVRIRLGQAERPAAISLSAAGATHRREGFPVGRDVAGSFEGVRSLLEAAGEPLREKAAEGVSSVRYLGQVFGVFLAFEQEDRVVFLDQHAAHEKVIFQSISEQAPQLQELLFPVSFDASAEEAARIAERTGELETMGVAVKSAGKTAFEVVALSAAFSRLPEPDLVALLKESAGQGEEWRLSLAATAACRLAVKEGDPVDPVTAAELFRQALQMENPRCPHGRPLWHEVGRRELYRGVDRPEK